MLTTYQYQQRKLLRTPLLWTTYDEENDEIVDLKFAIDLLIFEEMNHPEKNTNILIRKYLSEELNL